MSDSAQRTIFGEELNELINVETTGRVIRPFKRMLDQIASEYKLQFTDDGLSVQVVDSANVIGIESHIQASAFEDYTLASETTLGVNSSGLGSALRHARYAKRTDDPVTIQADKRTLETEVNREIGNAQATVNERYELIDPDSIRQAPDVPDLDLGITAEIEPETFIEATKLLETDSKHHVAFGSNPESIVLNQEEDLQQRNVELEVPPSQVGEFTLFTGDYIEDIANALRVGYVDDVTLRWDDEMPLFVDFEREGVYSGTIYVAPRIQA